MPMNPRLLRPLQRFQATPTGPLTATVTGFTGYFDAELWDRLPSSASNGNSSTVTATTATIVKNPSNAFPASASIGFDESLIDDLRPAGAGAFIGWTVTFDYAWSITGSVANSAYSFTALSDASGGDALNTSAPIGGTHVLSDTTTIDFIQFIVSRVTGGSLSSGTAVITNFEFTAEYDPL
jgi:hypothetical protein